MAETVRDMLCARERDTLCGQAFLSENSRGRDYPVSPDNLRTEFQRDRDRIIHSKAFRRLMHKTQVFLSPEDDHFRTRLTHTLEVMQIARTISRALCLNEDLTEAVAFGHDLGHTPFGHAGERVLQQCYSPDFTHCKQSLRVVEVIENLNLTWEVRDGIVNHTGDDHASTLEGRVVKLADRIAYINHDIDDACRAGVMCEKDIPFALRKKLGFKRGERIDNMVKSIVSRGIEDGEVEMNPDTAQAFSELRDFLFEHVYTNPVAKGEEARAESMLKQLYYYFIENPDKLQMNYLSEAANETVERRTADFIAGMTDRYAINIFKALFIPEVWHSGSNFKK